MSVLKHCDILPFDGTPADFVTRFDYEVLQHALNSDIRVPYQVYHHILTDAERHEEEELLADVAEPEEPGPVEDGATAGEIYNHKCDMEKYIETMKLFREFRLWFLSLIPFDVRHRVSIERQVEFARLSVRDMRLNLNAVYGILQAHDHRHLESLLKTPFTPGMDMDKHINMFQRVINKFELAGDPLSPTQQYLHLFHSMLTHPDYSSLVSDFEQHKAQDQHTFANLARALRLKAGHLSHIATANAAISPASASQVIPPNNASNRFTINGITYEAPTQYCWSHGHGFHSSKNCKRPKENHKSNATKANKMGGSTVEGSARAVRN